MNQGRNDKGSQNITLKFTGCSENTAEQKFIAINAYIKKDLKSTT